MSPLPIKSQKSIVHNCLIEKNPNAYPLGFLLSLIPWGHQGYSKGALTRIFGIKFPHLPVLLQVDIAMTPMSDLRHPRV